MLVNVPGGNCRNLERKYLIDFSARSGFPVQSGTPQPPNGSPQVPTSIFTVGLFLWTTLASSKQRSTNVSAVQPFRVQPPGSPGKNPMYSFPCIARDQWSQRAKISAALLGIIGAVEVPLRADRVDGLDRVYRHSSPFAVGDYVVDRFGEFALDLAPLERLRREERGHQPELKDVVAERREHVDESFPIGPAPTVRATSNSKFGLKAFCKCSAKLT